MASSPSPLMPPPSSGGGPDQNPTTPQAASPSPPQSSPAIQNGTQDIIMIVSKLRGIAKAYPSAAPIISQINDLMRQVMSAMMQNQSPGEPQAPPTGG